MLVSVVHLATNDSHFGSLPERLLGVTGKSLNVDYRFGSLAIASGTQNQFSATSKRAPAF